MLRWSMCEGLLPALRTALTGKAATKVMLCLCAAGLRRTFHSMQRNEGDFDKMAGKTARGWRYGRDLSLIYAQPLAVTQN